MKKYLTLFVILISVWVTNSQNEKSHRESFDLTVAIDTINFYKQKIDKTPYFVKENVLQIYPTEKINIEVEISKDSIIAMKVVKENLNPEKTIVLEFKQEVKNQKSERMMLTITNPFEKTLTYDAHMFIVGHDKWISTSIIPILPKLTNFEMWNDIILSLVLENWKLTTK
ncbi:hypothetical protein [Aquimarina sp. MAR_2010_214]|uniref:hypothetical protein n=1 Tax=Aquimarina sp. MAR_2010_214 TaxID=1250026 RepID=UPI000C70E6EB|nr:hypothetical protein [Aquimarina sp. MAR_2010_214]